MSKRLYLLISSLSLFYCSSFAQSPGSQNALDFNGSGDYVEIPDHTSINPGSAITVEAWINAGSFGSNSWDNSIFCKHGWASGQKGYVLRCGDNGKLSFNMANAAGAWVEAVSASVMETGQWYHVAGSFDGDTIAVYINGIMQAYTLYSGTISVSTGLNGKIGDLAYGAKRWFDGQIDEVKIWGEAVSEANLRNWMCRKVTTNHPNFSSLRAYWKMDEGNGKNIADFSSNSNTGDLKSPSWVYSGAAIGDTAVHTYSASDITLGSANGFAGSVKNITGTPACVQLYRVVEVTDVPLENQMYAELDSTGYFGVYMPKKSGSDFRLQLSYRQFNLNAKRDDCSFDMLSKNTGGGGSWGTIPTVLHPAGDSVVTSGRTQSEFMAVIYPTDSVKVIMPGKGKPYICESDSLLLTAVGNDSFTWQWYMDGNPMNGKTKRSIFVKTAAKYKVKAFRNGTSCLFESQSLEVTTRKNPVVTLTAFQPVCVNLDTVVLRGGSPKGGIFSGTGVVLDSVFLPSQNKPGKYDIIYQFTDTTACIAYDTETLEILARPTLTFSSSMSFCNDADSVKLYGISPTGGTYSGKYIRNDHFFLDSVNHIAGLYAYRYTYTDSKGCYSIFDDSLLIKATSPVFLSAINNTCVKDAPINLFGSPNGGQYAGNGVSGNRFDPAKAGIGKHNITYTFVNKENCPTTATQEAKVFNNTTVIWTYQITACENADSIKMKEGTPSGGFFSGTGVGTSGYFKPLLAKAGSHAIQYTFLDTNGCYNKATSTALVYDTATLFSSTIDPVCPSVPPFSLSYVSPQGGNYSGTGVSANEFSPSSVGPGNHQIKYELINANNCTSRADLMLTVVKTDSISVSLSPSICKNADPQPIKVFPTGGSLKGPGVIGNYISPGIAGVGKHQVIYTFFDSKGCIAKDTAEIVVADIPKVSLKPFNSVCDNASEFVLSGGLPIDSGKYFVNGLVQNSFDPSIHKKGLYSIKYVAINEYACSDSTEQKLRVNESPSKPLITIQSNTLKSNAPIGNQWYNLTGIISGANQQNYSPPSDGSYFVLVTNDSGCSKTSDTILFKKSGIADLGFDDMAIYPNPTDGPIHLKFSNHLKHAMISVYSMTGEKIFELADFSGMEAWFDIGHLTEGVYLIHVFEADERNIQKIFYVK